ncbi:MAG: ribosomal-processing cysteine protease Prp [Clostridia bacterium]|nr:ribosomal-processing cysteine protease Prp [Clostridia bacterium]MBR6773426.1 ribosomal-processing cysteine protease Prp [Clostridia bacterium]
MTEVKIQKKNGHIVKVFAQGHTGYGVEGEDIVCAGLSSIMQTAILGLMRVAGINAKVRIDDEEALIDLELPDLNAEDRHNADMILDTMLCGIADYYEGFSDFIDLEVK